MTAFGEAQEHAGVGMSSAASPAGSETQRGTDAFLGRWNWGAFAFTWVWGLFNGAYVPLFGLLIALIPTVDLWRESVPGGGRVWMSTGSLLLGAWSVYCGIMGDRWAWKGRRWDDRLQFRKTQHRWAVAAVAMVVVLGVAVAVGVVGASTGLAR